MENPCYKCGQAVEEGVPFCPHCSAPQIRVVLSEPLTVPAFDTEAESAAESPSAITAAHASQITPLPGGYLLKPAALAALVASVLVSLGLNPFVAMLGVGFLAVILYRQRAPGFVRARTGARLGALSSMFFFSFSAILTAVAWAIPSLRTLIRTQIAENIQKLSASRPDDPQMQALVSQLKTPEGLMVWMLLGILVFVVVATIGGAIAGKLLGRGRTK